MSERSVPALPLYTTNLVLVHLRMEQLKIFMQRPDKKQFKPVKALLSPRRPLKIFPCLIFKIFLHWRKPIGRLYQLSLGYQKLPGQNLRESSHHSVTGCPATQRTFLYGSCSLSSSNPSCQLSSTDLTYHRQRL